MLTLQTSTINILIVDDNPDNLRLLSKILESRDYVTRKSLNGKAALKAAQREPPDLILLDINMPEMNGYEVCRQLKQLEVTRQIPIIFVSALDQIDNKVRAFEIGGQDYITKPFQELEVLARVKNQLLIRQQQQLLAQQNQQLQQEIEFRQEAEAQFKRLNSDLERQVQIRTLELQQALSCELALKLISERVRDSLDQHQILQMTVETLAWALDVHCCDAALYNSDHSASTIRYQWVESQLEATQGQTLYMADFPELYEQLKSRISFTFCQTQPSPIRNHSATLACPIFDERVNESGILGDLWLFRDTYSSFSEIEIHLVEQAATYCAIALRQARLYEAAQAQVKELEQLNQLKDDFLNTISHELRTPLASMKMVLKLLNTLTDQGRNLITELAKTSAQESKVVQYFRVLQDECDRELALVEDLLNLQHIESGTYAGQLVTTRLQDLLPHLIEPFQLRAHYQQQTFKINLASDLPDIKLDLHSFTRIITELMSNAFKYTPAGGTISISAALIQDTTLVNSTKLLRLDVVNTGIEIKAKELSRIFDKFYRIPNNDPWKHGGTGLGLALTKKLVEQMNGEIEVKSANNETRFTIQIQVS